MSVLYFGDPLGALALLDRGVRLVGVVHGRPGGVGRSRLIPQVRHLPRWTTPDLADPVVVAALAALEPALIVGCFYPRRIPMAVLDLAPGLNVHPSDLPRWRGPDPCHWTVRAGDATTALCVQWLAEGLDEGAVLSREVLAVGPRENAGHLATRLERLGAERIAEVAVRVLGGEIIEATPQSGEVTWAPLVPGDDLEIDWSRPAAEVDRLVRASAPDPGAFTGIGSELIVVFAGQPVEAGAFSVLPPGTPFVRKGLAHIRCADEAYRLDRLQVGRKALSGRAFAGLLV